MLQKVPESSFEITSKSRCEETETEKATFSVKFWNRRWYDGGRS